jgi:hypothetical protein
MEGLLAATFVGMNLQRTLFESQLDLLQSGMLVHQQHIVQGRLRHEKNDETLAGASVDQFTSHFNFYDSCVPLSPLLSLLTC